MFRKIIPVVTGIFLLLMGAIVFAADAGKVDLYFNGTKLNDEIRAVSKDGTKFVNLPFLIKYLHVVTEWQPESGEISLRIGMQNVKMAEDQSDYTVDGKTNNLSKAPFENDGQLWVPVDFLKKIGLSVVKEDSKTLYLRWADNYLLAIENINYQGRPAFLLVGTKKPVIKSFLLTGPDRLVVDLIGFKAHPAFDTQNSHNQLVNGIRVNQFQNDTLRLVFDLSKLAGFKIIPDPENENQMIVVFNYFVESIDFYQKDDERKVLIKTSFPAQYETQTMVDPDRMVIDFKGATLDSVPQTIPGDAKWIKSVRMSQFNSQTVRVVLDLVGDIPSFITPSRQDPKLLEVRTIHQITNVSWNDLNLGGELCIESNGNLVEEIQRLRNPNKLRIDLNYANFQTELRAPQIKNEQITGIKFISIDNYKVRIEVDLNFFMGYTARFSEDRHQLVISFKKSPIIGKIIVLDAGHGGVDMGATGRQGTREKDVNYEVTLRLKNMLEEAGAKVILTRNDDTFISLYERSFMANYLSADIFISIHTNFHPNSNVKGIEVYHYKDRADSFQLAKKIETKMVECTKMNTLGVKVNDFVVIRETQMPSVLVELGFLSNFEEENLIRTTEFREQSALGIFQGILEYYYSSL